MTPAYSSQKNGFTLIEIVIATTIFLVVSTISVASFLASSKSVRKIASDREVHQAARLAFEQMSRDFRMARAIACQAQFDVSNCIISGGRYPTDHIRICAQDGTTVRDYQLKNRRIVVGGVELTPAGIFVKGQMTNQKLFQVLPSHLTGTDDPCTDPAISSVKTQPFIELSAQFFNYDPDSPPAQPEKGATVSLQTMVTLRNFVKQYQP